LENFYRADGFCLGRHGNGNMAPGCRWRDRDGNERQELLRPGVGIAGIVDCFFKDGQKRQYAYETCAARGGSGNSKAV